MFFRAQSEAVITPFPGPQIPHCQNNLSSLNSPVTMTTWFDYQERGEGLRGSHPERIRTQPPSTFYSYNTSQVTTPVLCCAPPPLPTSLPPPPRAIRFHIHPPSSRTNHPGLVQFNSIPFNTPFYTNAK